QYIIFGIAILAGVGAMILMQLYIKEEKAKLFKMYEMTPVIAVAEQLSPGTQVSTKNIATLSIPRKLISDNHILQKDVPDILGRKLSRTVDRNQPLLWSDFDEGEKKGGGLANMVKEGDRAVSIPVDGVSSVTGLVEPSDHVDILGTFSFP